MLTRPDAASGRRGRPSPSPVARLALEHDIPVLRPARPNSDEFVAELTELAPECCAVVAYGALLSERLLAVPKRGWVNLHFSLLPAWRGAAPVQAAIAAGDTVTGATTFQIELSLDSGPVYGVVTETIQPTDTAGDLLERLSISGAALLETTLDGIADGSLNPVPQPSGRNHGGAEDHRRAGAGALGPARPRRRAAHPGRHPQPRRVDADRRSARQAGTGRRYPPIRRKRCRPVQFGSTATACGSAPDRSRCCSAAFSRRAARRWSPPTGRAAPGSTSPRRSDAPQWQDAATGDRPYATTAASQAARSGPPRGVRRVAGGVRARRLRQSGAARLAARAWNHRPRRGVRHRTDLRHMPHPRPARRRHRPRRRAPARAHRPGAAGPVAAGHLPIAAHPGRRARRGLHHRRAGRHRIRFGASGFRQRGAAHDLRAGRTVLGRRAGPAGGFRSGRARRVHPRPSPLDRSGVRRRAGRRRRTTGCLAGQRRRTPAGALGGPARRADRGRTSRTGQRHARPLFALRRLSVRR